MTYPLQTQHSSVGEYLYINPHFWMEITWWYILICDTHYCVPKLMFVIKCLLLKLSVVTWWSLIIFSQGLTSMYWAARFREVMGNEITDKGAAASGIRGQDVLRWIIPTNLSHIYIYMCIIYIYIYTHKLHV